MIFEVSENSIPEMEMVTFFILKKYKTGFMSIKIYI